MQDPHMEALEKRLPFADFLVSGYEVCNPHNRIHGSAHNHSAGKEMTKQLQNIKNRSSQIIDETFHGQDPISL